MLCEICSFLFRGDDTVRVHSIFIKEQVCIIKSYSAFELYTVITIKYNMHHFNCTEQFASGARDSNCPILKVCGVTVN